MLWTKSSNVVHCQDGSEKLRQAKANLSDDLAYVQAGSRRASKYDLYWTPQLQSMYILGGRNITFDSDTCALKINVNLKLSISYVKRKNGVN